jgi:hypothetical protein
MCIRMHVIIGLVSYLPKVGGSVASFIVVLALAWSITFRNCILSPDTILEKDHPVTIPSKFGSNWATGSRQDGFYVNFP